MCPGLAIVIGVRLEDLKLTCVNDVNSRDDTLNKIRGIWTQQEAAKRRLRVLLMNFSCFPTGCIFRIAECVLNYYNNSKHICWAAPQMSRTRSSARCPSYGSGSHLLTVLRHSKETLNSVLLQPVPQYFQRPTTSRHSFVSTVFLAEWTRAT